ncbi:MAG TPA: coenzyme F420-0:L-glutamate ligase, partial [Solirubrobacteraceae bacterium]|nr:coenzyme F420-0:L-glutamate ligase [Solirubrobacteraceae bacterium]
GPLEDWRGRADADGRELHATWIAVADEAAAAADLVRGKDSRIPAVAVHGLERHVTADDGPGAAALVRPRAEDLF